MSPLAVAFVLSAAVIHATWNLLTKRSTDKLVFLWWTGVVGSVVLLPAVAWLSPAPAWDLDVWARMALGAALRATYFAALSAAYSRGDLSLVYPLARGIAPVLVPAAAIVFLGERLTLEAALGIAAVAAGVYVINVPRLDRRGLLAPLSALTSSAAGFAALTGVLTASYSVVDKWTMNTGLSPAWYAYFTIPVAALLLTPFVWRHPRRNAEWRLNRAPIVAVSVLISTSYLFVLHALRLAPVSHVVPAREIAIVFGAILGAVILHEPHGRQRVVGAILIVTGVVAISLSR
ncbi:MAG TPA: DMT family transporter [Methylomirabilota bacterium]|nr:DMT family transporter [Methylomirabilota bacterium]